MQKKAVRLRPSSGQSKRRESKKGKKRKSCKIVISSARNAKKRSYGANGRSSKGLDVQENQSERK